jgi:hypothetical protein
MHQHGVFSHYLEERPKYQHLRDQDPPLLENHQPIGLLHALNNSSWLPLETFHSSAARNNGTQGLRCTWICRKLEAFCLLSTSSTAFYSFGLFHYFSCVAALTESPHTFFRRDRNFDILEAFHRERNERLILKLYSVHIPGSITRVQAFCIKESYIISAQERCIFHHASKLTWCSSNVLALHCV